MGRGAGRRRQARSVRVPAAAVLTLALLGGCGGSERLRPAAGRSTLQVTLRDPDGDGHLSPAPGEPLRDRTDLAPARRPGRVLATWAQISDAHVRDEESPARVPFLDRFGRPFQSTFRPQETLSAQVLAAAVRAVRAARPGQVFVTGDLIDNDQADELGWALTLLRGGRVVPDSGAPGYVGPQAEDEPDPFYLRPDVDAPRHPGLLAAAQRPVRSPGLGARWWPVIGNHDVLVQGEAAPTPRTRAVAVGDRALWTPPPGFRPNRAGLRALVASPLTRGTVRVPPDTRRRELSAAEVTARLRAASGAPAAGALLDYSVRLGPGVRAIVLDLTDRAGGSRGIVHPGQAAWLRSELARAGEDRVIVVSHQPLPSVRGAQELLGALDADPHVVAALAGDTHHARIEPRRTPAGGFWLVTAPSLADYPQQARAFALRETAGGGVALETWLLDTAPDPLADAARELGYLDAQGGRPQGLAGTLADRNVRLFRR